MYTLVRSLRQATLGTWQTVYVSGFLPILFFGGVKTKRKREREKKLMVWLADYESCGGRWNEGEKRRKI